MMHRLIVVQLFYSKDHQLIAIKTTFYSIYSTYIYEYLLTLNTIIRLLKNDPLTVYSLVCQNIDLDSNYTKKIRLSHPKILCLHKSGFSLIHFGTILMLFASYKLNLLICYLV